MGLFDKFKQGLKKTTQLLKTDIRDLFKCGGRLVNDAFLKELFETLIKTDMGVEAAQEIVADIDQQFRARVVEMSQVLDEIKTNSKPCWRSRPSQSVSPLPGRP